MVVRLVLDVYKFAPWKPHGDETCGKGRPPADAGSDASTGGGDGGDGAPTAP